MAGDTRAHAPDYILFGVTIFLLVLGLFVMASASLVISSTRFGSEYHLLLRQFVGVGVGALLFYATWRIRYTVWKSCAPLLLILSLVLMVMVFLPATGLEFKGAKRWVDFKIISIQPSEIFKLTFVMYLAAWLEAKRRAVAHVYAGLLPFALMLGIVSALFVLQPDIGTLGVLVLTSLLLFFIGGGRVSHIALLITLGIIALAIVVAMQPYRKDRLMVFLHPDEDTQGIGYQLNQSLIAIGSGGAIGRGFGMSRQKFNYLPEPAGDSIFAIYGEEFGFAGSMVLITAFLILFWRGMRISSRAPDGFGKLLAAGITLLIIVQAFINIAAISGVLPLTGLPLTFISFGSTALVIHLASMGILMNISRYTV